ncbi:MAG TPA: pitrilysin family protein [Candidatus Saccharibacteria bacterium]|nr:pitrilysin family protein [Candidatus Saccharibacteria bacterium]
MPLKHTVNELKLSTGASGLIVNVPDSTVMSYTIHFRAGNDFARAPEIHQTAHLMEHMAFGPNEEFDTMEAFSQEFSRNGAFSNASTFDTNMHYYADCAQFEWRRILELQQLAITRPRFLPEILEAEKGNVHEELAGQAHNNPRVMWQHINRAMGGHSLLDNEKIATIDAVTVDDIIEHHTRTHTHLNMRFVLAGDFSGHEDEVKTLLESWRLPRGERLEPRSDGINAAPPVLLKRADQENSNFGIVMVIRRHLSTDDLVAMAALNHVLTGTMHSRIWGKARADGICYGMGSNSNVDLDGTSSWEFYGQVRPENADALYSLIVKEIKRVAAGDISEHELDETKQFLTGDYQMRGQTVGALAGWYGGDYFFDGTIDPIADADKRISAITRERMVALAQEFLAAGIWALGEIGNVKKADNARHYKTLDTLFA